MPTECPALLLIAHGSRQPEANADLSRLAAELRRTGRFAHVEPAYLELAEPDIDAGAANCVEQGALRQTLTKQKFPVVDGDISVPEEPGLGIELDEKVVEKYRVG